MPGASHREDNRVGHALNVPEVRYISGTIFEPHRERELRQDIVLASKREETSVGKA